MTLTGGLAAGANAQSTFLKMYNRGNSGWAVREVPGGYTVAGGTDHYFNWHWFQLSPPASTDIHLFKTDLNGTLQWERVIGTPLSRSIARWMEPTADGGYIIAGCDSKEKFWPPDSNDVVLIKTDATGNISWSRIFDSGKDDLAYGVQQTSDGGYIVSGFHDQVPISAVGSTSILLIKTDALGVTQWAEKIPFAIRDFITGEPFSYVVKQTADGGYVVVGTSLGALTMGVYVVRLDALGGVLWAKVYDHNAAALRYSTGLDILEHSNGDFLIAGSMDKSQPLETNYPYVLRINASGALLAAKFYETVPVLFFQSGFSAVRPTTTGGFFFSGMGGYGEFGDQAQLLKTDADLNTIWSRVYTWDGMATMGARNGRPTSDGGYIFTGKRQFVGTVVMKTDHAGLIPCKTPNALSLLLPSINVQDKFPVPVPLAIGAPLLFSISTPLADSTTVCPVSQSTLPVELGYFTASAISSDEVQLAWSTFTEHQNDHFVVERSADGSTFEEAGRIEGAGNSSSPLHYALTDHTPPNAPVAYYRLTQVDHDGSSSRSAVVTATFQEQGLQVLAVMSDAEDRTVDLVLSTEQGGKVELCVSDLAGRTVLVMEPELLPGTNTIRFSTAGQASGIHLFTIRGVSACISGKLGF